MNRAKRRALSRNVGEDTTENLAQKISQFGNLPESCNVCQESFDKQNKEMVQSWNVVVRQETVRLFCPECIRKTREALNERK